MPAACAGDVPQGGVDGRQPAYLGAAHLGAAADRVDEQRVPVLLDGQRILAQQQRRGHVVDVRGDGGRRAERVADADQAFVGMHLDERDVGMLGEVDGLESSDLHDER